MRTAFLEPSLDRVFAFSIDPQGVHPLATFCEYENEIKAPEEDLVAKLEQVDALLDFDRRVAESFHLRLEPLDKYHRCLSFFLAPLGTTRRTRKKGTKATKRTKRSTRTAQTTRTARKKRTTPARRTPPRKR